MAGAETYTPGYCTWYVARTLSWVRGGWGNAWQWAARAQAAGFQLSKRPAVGAVVVYGPGNGYSEYGHVAIVRAVYPLGLFLVQEMAAVQLYVVTSRVSNLHDVTGFILPPGVPSPDALPVPPPVQAPGIEATLAAWSSLADWLNRVVPAATSELGRLRGIVERIT